MLNAVRRTAPFCLLVAVTLLSAFGIAMLYSTTADTYGERILTRQVVWMVTGAGLALAVNVVGYRRLGRWSVWILLAVALPLLYLVLGHVLDRLGVPDSILGRMPFTEGAINGSWRWLKIGPFSVQPSEFAKVAIILYLTHYYSSNPRYLDDFRKGLCLPLGIVGGVIVLVLLGGSLSITAITGMVVMGLLMVVGIRLRYFLIFVSIGMMLLMGVIMTSPERLERLTTFRQPELHRQDEGYQLFHSQLALGAGGWRGVGFNRSHMKELYLPEAHTDFIMAIVGEELGYAGILGVILLYLLLLVSAFAISVSAADREGTLLAFGIGLSLGLHAFANLGVVSGFLPTTGVTAPLISYGGSSMVSTWIGLGLLVNVAREALYADEWQDEPQVVERNPPPLVRYRKPGTESGTS